MRTLMLLHLKMCEQSRPWELVIPKGFPRSMGRVESRLLRFPLFPYSVMSCFGNAYHKITVAAKARFREQEPLVRDGDSAKCSFRIADHPVARSIQARFLQYVLNLACCVKLLGPAKLTFYRSFQSSPMLGEQLALVA